jgi:hypothetical protein
MNQTMSSTAPPERGMAQRKERKKERERKYNCLKSREGIVNVKYERILFTMLTFLLK